MTDKPAHALIRKLDNELNGHLPIPTYRADEFSGSTQVCGLLDVKKLLFMLWMSRAATCKFFGVKRYLLKHPKSKCRVIGMTIKLLSAQEKCMAVASRYGKVDPKF